MSLPNHLIPSIDRIEWHPLAAKFPMMPGAELDLLAKDIAERGVQTPIVIVSGRAGEVALGLDGRNRWEACKRANVSCPVQWLMLSARDQETFIRAANQRRHMGTDARVVLAASLGDPRPLISGCTDLSWQKARALKNTAPDLAAKVMRGELTLTRAYNIAFPPVRKAPRSRAATGSACVEVNDTMPAPPPGVEPKAPPTADEILAAAEQRSGATRAKAEARAMAAELSALRAERGLLAKLTSAPLPPIERLEFGSGLREACPVVLASDWHIEELVRPSKATFANAYTLSIADLRIKRLFAGALWSVNSARQAFLIRTLMLWLGGDIISGDIHEENLETAQLTSAAAIVWVFPRIIAGIDRLLNEGEFERIDIPCSYGNHGRTTKTMRFTTGAGHNFEWLLYQQLAHHYRDEPRVRFLADETEHQFHRIYDLNWHGHHGHRVSYGGGIGGIMIPINKANANWDIVERCDLHNYGHFHQWHDVGGTTINGSLIGYNAYAMGIKARPERATQAIYYVDSKRGKSRREPLWVTDPSAEKLLWAEYDNAERRNRGEAQQ